MTFLVFAGIILQVVEFIHEVFVEVLHELPAVGAHHAEIGKAGVVQVVLAEDFRVRNDGLATQQGSEILAELLVSFGIGAPSMPRHGGEGVEILHGRLDKRCRASRTPGQRIIHGTRMEVSHMLGRLGPVTPPATHMPLPLVWIMWWPML